MGLRVAIEEALGYIYTLNQFKYPIIVRGFASIETGRSADFSNSVLILKRAQVTSREFEKHAYGKKNRAKFVRMKATEDFSYSHMRNDLEPLLGYFSINWSGYDKVRLEMQKKINEIFRIGQKFRTREELSPEQQEFVDANKYETSKCVEFFEKMKEFRRINLVVFYPGAE